MGPLPIWNLADLYTSIKSKKITQDLNNIKKSSASFEKKYEGKIATLESIQLFNAIVKLEKIDELMDKILSYASLLVAENTENAENRIFFQMVQEKITRYSSSLILKNKRLENITTTIIFFCKLDIII